MFERIIVPLDGSELAEQALTKAVELSKSVGAPLLLIRVVDIASLARYAGATPVAGADFGLLGQVLDEEREDAKTYITQVVERLEKDGLKVSGEVLQGSIASSIVEAAHPADVIVIASHGRTGVQRWFLGSVAEDVIRRATCPVMLVRNQHAEEKTTASA